MVKNPYPGKFIVLEGLDGSGKSTQLNLLFSRLKSAGYDPIKTSFPQYGKKSAGLVEEYLAGKYGDAESVGPWRASIFYACDRYDASFTIRKWLKQRKIILSNRYIASNMGHQGGKIKDPKTRRDFLKWLYNLEYRIFGIPKPDTTIILKTSPKLSQKLCETNLDRKKKKKAYLKNKILDIHEGNLSHLENALCSYLQVAKEFPKDFKLVECLENGKLLSPEIIHEKIWQEVQKIILT